MLKWAIIFLVIAIIAGLLVFRDVSTIAGQIAKVFFFIFLFFFSVELVLVFIATNKLIILTKLQNIAKLMATIILNILNF